MRRCVDRMFKSSAAAALIAAAVGNTPATGQIVLPNGFVAIPITPVLDQPVGMAFAPDGRLFVVEKKGVVRVIQNGALLPTPFIDLQEEVNGQGDRGLLGIALEPNFLTGRHVWLLYSVDPIPGEPDEATDAPLFGRLVRYQGTSASGGNVAGPNSRHVLMGNDETDGAPCCWTTHGIGSVRFGADGSLFISTGDGARFEFADPGGYSVPCLWSGVIDDDQNIGAFRSQNMNSLAGKILRVDPFTGEGLPDNPYWTGTATDRLSKIWVSGLRNPFRFAVKPGTSPGVLYIGDVGWTTDEEISASAPSGGNNFGWPCYEGFNPSPDYPEAQPNNSGCDTIGTPGNPGNLTAPFLSWNHWNSDDSIPPGYSGNATTSGAFHSGGSYPVPYRNAFFYGDFIRGWIKVAKMDAKDQLINYIDFATDAVQPTDWAIDPGTGELCFVSMGDQVVYRIHYTFNPADLNQSGAVNIDDLLGVINGWGPCTPAKGQSFCPSDVTDDGETNIDDLLMVINNWG